MISQMPHLCNARGNCKSLFCLTDRALKVIQTNSAFRELFQPAVDDLKGKSFYELIRVEELEQYERARLHCLSHPDSSIRIDMTMRTPGTASRCFRWEISAVTGPYNAISGIRFVGTDVTLLKTLEQQQLYQATLLENISDAVISTDTHLIIKSWNKAAERLYGLPASKVIGKRTAEVFNYQYLTDSRERSLNKLIASGTWKGEVAHTKADGTVLYLDASVCQVKDTNGQVIGYVSVNRDISEVKRANERMLTLQHRNQLFIDNLAEGIIVFSSQGDILVCNEAAESILGLSRMQMMGRTSVDPRWRTIHEDGRPYPVEEHPSNVTLRTGKACQNEVIGIYTPDSKIRWVSVNTRSVSEDGNNQIAAVVCSFVDITQQKEAERALKKAEYNQRTVLSTTREGFFMLDTNHRIVMLNRAAHKFLHDFIGVKTREGADFLSVVPANRHKEVLDTLAAALKGDHEEYEVHYDSARGPVWLLFTYSPIKNGEEITGICIVVKNITKRKQAEETIARSEQRFRAIFNSTYQFIGLMQPDGILLEANETALEFAGLLPRDVVGKHIWETAWWKASHHSKEKLQRVIRVAAAGHFVRYEVELTGRNGQTAQIDFSIKPVKDKNGKIILLLPEGRLLDEQRKAERRLLETQEQLKSFMDHTPTFNWIADEQNRLRYLNPNSMRAFGIGENAIGQSIFDIFPPYIADQYHANNQKVWDSNDIIEAREEAITPDGTKHVQHVFKFPLGKDKDGIRLMGGVAMDITQLIKTKAALRKGNERYHYASKATSDAIWDWDVRENKIQLGEVSKILFGCQEEITSMDDRKAHIHPEDLPAYTAVLQQAFDGEHDRWQLEYRFRGMDGRYRIVTDRAYILRDNNKKVIRMIGAMQDITEQRMLEKQLVEEAAHAKQEIIQAIIIAEEKQKKEISNELHDNVNQILATCKLYLDIMRKEEVEPEFIDTCYNHIQLAIDEIRNISHTLTPAALKDINLRTAIQEMVERINASGKLQIAFKPSGRITDKKIPADLRIAIYRIIQEQISNILKHAAASTVQIHLKVTHGVIHLTVKDDGKGFDPKKVKRGLGISNIGSRLEFYEGRMELQSAPGKGCTLAIEVPAGNNTSAPVDPLAP